MTRLPARWLLRRINAVALEEASSWLLVIALIVSAPTASPPMPAAQQLPAMHCSTPVTMIDHGRVREEVQHALEWNRLLSDSPLASPERGGYYTAEEVLARVDSWTPTIACLAREVAVPPELLAGLVATELYMDYNIVDVVVDGLIRSECVIGEMLSYVVRGGGYASVHITHLVPALKTLGKAWSSSPFYTAYYDLITTLDLPGITRLATRDLIVDLMDAAVMARYYADLRLGNRHIADMTTDDMAFVWSAYRGGVAGTPADPDPGSRWSLDYLRAANQPYIFGDTLVALPFFSYYHDVYHTPHASQMPPESP